MKTLSLKKIDAPKEEEMEIKMTGKHWVALVGAVSALAIQVSPLGSLHIGALVGMAIMLIGGAIKWKDLDEMLHSGIGMMGFIAFVMLVAAGYGSVIRETGGVDQLVESAEGCWLAVSLSPPR